MTCEEAQRIANRLLDDEVPWDASREVFSHLASCDECRRFFHQAHALCGMLDRAGEPTSEQRALAPSVRGPSVPEGFWHRRIALRYPVAAIVASVVLAVLVISVEFSRRTETVFVATLNPVVVTAGGNQEGLNR